MFKKIREHFSKRKRLAKKQPQVLRYEELEQRVLFSADVVPGLDTAAVEEQVIVQDVDSDVPAEREAAPETVEQKDEEARSELVLVNENVSDYEQLIADLQGSDDNRIIEVVVLESDRDGIEQVSDILSERSDLAAVHVITHGSDGQINLGDSWLNSFSLQENRNAVAGWGNALTETGDILFYGCNIAAQSDGQGLLEGIAGLTGADVTASDDPTGHTSLGGDWDLEYRTGGVEASVAVDAAAQAEYQGVLNAYVVSNTNATGSGSLHQAILDANANVGVTDTITFNISGGGPQTIAVDAGGLPIITDSVILDATTQPGYSGTPLITLDGSATPASSGINGIRLQANDSTVKGFIVINFADEGIEMDGSTGFGDNNIIQNNWVGIDAAGNVAGNAEHGIMISANASGNQIGGTGPNEGNVFAGNGFSGIIIQENSDNNIVEGNIIGLKPDGATPAANGDHGILIQFASDGNRIGGTAANASNVISGNTLSGIYIDGTTDATYTTAVTNTLVQGNFIGTDITGTLDRGNAQYGVRIVNGADNNTIGGTTAGHRNVISGNNNGGIYITGSGTDSNVIQGNYVGTDVNGTNSVYNSGNNININQGATNTLIGGSVAGAGNTIAFGANDGITIWSWNTTGTIVQGNYIGTDATGTLDLGNSNHGVVISGDSDDNLIGGTDANEGNLIYNNDGSGVDVRDAGSLDNAILGNSIIGNTGPGIDLGGDGVTTNDPNDGDPGSNNLQNYPVLTQADLSGTDLTVSGSLDSDAVSTQFRIEFFGNATGSEDASGYGEGSVYLGYHEVTTDGSGDASFSNVTLSGVSLSGGDFVTATVTKIDDPGQVGVDDLLAYGETSEFAANVAITAINPPTAVNDAYAVDEGGTLNPDESWWNLDWNARRKLTFDNSGQTEDLLNFPVLVTLDSTRIDYTQTQADGADLRFVDTDGTVLDHEIEGTWTNSGTNTVWVRVPQIDGSSNSDFIWMYYGNNAASSVEDSAGVWNSDHLGVWHLGEEQAGTGTNGVYQDSTAPTYHGDDEVSATGQDGQIGGGQQFDGSDDFIDLWDSGIAAEAYTAFTISAWYKSADGTIGGPTYGTDEECIFWADTEAGSSPGEWPCLHFGITDDPGHEGQVRLRVTHDWYDGEANGWGEAYGTTNVMDQEWHHLVAVRTGGAGSRLIIYVDGNEEANIADASGGQLLDFAPGTYQEFYIGAYEWNNNHDYVHGALDEVRISNAAQSKDRIAAEYLSMTDSFITFSPAGVMTNDSDPDGDVLTAILDSGPSHASSFRLSPDGSFVYVHDGGAATSDSFTYHLTDGTADSAMATVTITINHAPTFTSDGGGATAGINVAENTTAVTTVTATNVDAGDTLTYSIDPASDDAAKFNINSTTGELTFITAPDFEVPADANGDNVYEVIVQVDDGNTGTDTQTINVTVTDENETPLIWNYQKNIDLSASTPFDDYLVKVELSSANFDYAHVQADGEDIRFAEMAGNKLAFWMETWNPTGTSVAWVNVPVTGTTQIQMLYGNSGAGSASKPPVVLTQAGYDNFSGGAIGDSPTNWTPIGGASAVYAEDGGDIVLTDTTAGGAPVIFDGPALTDAVVTQQFQSVNGVLDHPGLIVRYVDNNNYVYGGVTELSDNGVDYAAAIWQKVGGTWTSIGIGYDGLENDGQPAWIIPDVSSGWHKQELRVTGDTVTLYIDGNLIGSATLSGAPAAGQTGFFAQYGGNEALRDEHLVQTYPTQPTITTTVNSENNHHSFSLAENTAFGTVVGNVIASDPDAADTLIYSITAGNTGTAFAIDNNGQITVNNADALDYETTPVFTLTVHVQDQGGTGLIDTATITVNLNDLNDAPVLTASAGTTAYAEQAAATVIDSAITLVDADGFAGVDPSDQYSAVIQITGNYEAADILGFTNTSNIQGVLVGDTLTLSVIGGQTATIADFQAALRTVTYYNGSNTLSELDRTISFSFDDGVDSSNITTKVVQVTAVNDAPDFSLTLDGTPTFTEDGPAVVLDSNVAILDAELTAADNFDGATLTLVRNGGAKSNDVFSATGTLSALTEGGGLVIGGTTIGAVTTNSTGTLVLTFNANATNALVDQAMQQIAYSNTSHVPPASVQIDWTFDDGNSGAQGTGGALQALGSTTVNITNVAPMISATGAATVNEGEIYTLNLSSNDPVDTWTINWGDGTIETIAGNLTSATHTYTVGGLTNNITVSATDVTGTYYDSKLIIGNAATGTDGFLLMAGFDPNTGLADIAGAQILNSPTPSDLDWAADVVVGPNGDIYATGYESGNVVRFDGNTGAFVEELVTTTQPVSIAFGPDGNLYVASNLGHVKRFDGTTSAYIDDFLTLGYTPEEMTFGADGNLYVGEYNPGRIYRYDGDTGAPLDGGAAFIDPELTGTTADDINYSEQFAFGPDGNIYVASMSDGMIQRYSGVNGSFIDTFATPGLTGAGWPNGPTGVAFGPDGHLYVTTVDRVERYDGTTGAYIDDYIPVGAGLDNPWFSTFTPNHQVTVISAAPTQVNNTGSTVTEGGTDTITSSELRYDDSEQPASSVTYTVTGGLANGQLELTGNPGVAITSFTQAQIDAGEVVYVHDGSNTTSDSFNFSVDDGQGNTLAGQSFSITVTVVDDDAPVQTNNTGSTVTEGGTDTIISGELLYTDSEQPASSVTYTVTGGLANGQLELTGNPGVAIISFSQAQINAGEVVYVHDGSNTTSDSFNFSVDDGQGNTLVGQSFSITVTAVDDDVPALVNNAGSTAVEGGSDTLITAELLYTDSEQPAASVTYTVTGGLANGQLELTGNPGAAVTSFTQAQIDSSEVVYVHDGSNTISDSFNFSVDDGQGNTLAGQTFNLTITAVDDDAPVQINNAGSTAVEGGSDTLITAELLYTDSEQPASSVTYTVTGGLANGQLELTGNPGVAVTSFTQVEINAGELVYVHDGSNTTSDNFNFSVDDGQGNTLAGQSFAITVTAVDNDAPVQTNNTGSTVVEGGTDTIISGELLYTDSEQPASAVTYTVTAGLVNGQLELTGNPGVAIASFTQAQIDAGEVVYVHDGSNTTSDSFNFSVDDGQGNTLAGQSFSITVTAVDDDAPVQTNNTGSTVAEGGTDTIISGELLYTDSEQPAGSVTYTVTGGLVNGQLELTGNPGVAVTSFTQAQINAGEVVYVHDDSNTTSDSFNFSVDDGQGNTLGGQSFSITVTAVDDDAPVQTNNTGSTVAKGGTDTIISGELLYTDSEQPAGSVTYTVTGGLANGQLELTTDPGTAVTSFTQDDIDNNRLVYVHDGSNTTTDSFNFSVTDGQGNTLAGQSFALTVTAVDVDAPVQVNKTGSTVTEGGTDTLNNTELRYDDSEQPASSVTYTVTGGLNNGQLELTTDPGTAVTSFTQDDIDNNRLVYVHDGSNTTTDSFNFSVTDGQGNTLAGQGFALTVTAVDDDAPTQLNNTGSTVTEGGTDAITNGELRYDDSEQPASSVTYTVTGGLTNGQLELTTDPGTAVTSFTQDDIDNNRLIYVHDDSETTSDSFNFTVDDGQGNSVTGQYFAITVTPVNDAPVAREDSVGLTFDGVDDYVRIGDYPGLTVSNSVTMEAWIRPSGAGTGTQIIVNKEGEYEFAITSDTGEIKWSFANTDPGWGWHNTGYFAQAAEWTHIAVTYSNGVVNTYADGALVDTHNGTGVIADEYPAFNELQIGGRENAVTQRFDGQIDEVRVWDTERTQLEIQTNMNTLLAGNETGLLGNWRFDEGSGTTVTDQSVNGYHGTLADGVTVAEMPDWEGYVVSEDGTVNVSAANGVLSNDFDIDGDPLTAVLDSGPSNATSFTLNPDGSFTYTPVADFNGIDTFTYHANDGSADSNIVTVTIRVDPVNDVPVINNATFNLDESSTNGTVVGAVPVTDPDAGDTHVYSITVGNTGGAFAIDNAGNITVANSAALNFETTPVFTLTVQAQDQGGTGLIDTATITVNLNDINDAPVLGAIGNQTVDELATLTFTATATDADLPADTLTFSLDAASIALGMTIDANTGFFSWTPTEGQGGLTPSVTVTVTDSGTGNLTDSETFTITVNDINVAPVLNPIGNQTVDELATLSFTATATDTDLPADTLTFSIDAASIALGMSIDANTGVFTWAPTEGQGGMTPSVTITVTDSGTGNLVDSETFTITVNDVNVAPVLGAIGNQTVDELATLTFTATATDTDLPVDTLTYSLDAASIALGMTIDANTGVFSWTPTEGQGGLTPSVTISVTDSGTGNLTDSETFTITVNDINVAPVLGAIGNQTVDELANLTFTATATDADLPADTLTYSLDAASIALGMSIDANTGVFNWTPTEAQGGMTPSVTVTVTDSGSGNLVDSETFTITVNEINVAPVINNATFALDENASIGSAVGYVPVTDPDAGDTHVYSITAGNTGGAFAINNGGNITVANSTALDFETTPVFILTVQVQDQGGTGLIDTATITVDLNNLNEAPISSGIANVTVSEDSPNTVIDLFAAFADTEDADANLTYTITANTNPGLFAATPIDGIAGTLTLDYAPNAYGTANITVRATDTSALWVESTFTVTVNPVSDNGPGDNSNPNPILPPLEDPETDQEEESDTEDPTYEAPGEDPLAEDEPLLLVEEYQAPEDSADADDSIVVMKDLQDEEIQEFIYLTDEIDRNAQPEGREDDRGYTYYDNDLYKDMSSLKYWNLIDNAAQSGPVAVNLDDINFHDFDSEDNDPVIIDENYDALRQEIDESFDTELKGQSIKAKIVTATAATFTVGIVSYLLRAGSLVASMMSALPLWRGFDPIAIFSGDKKKKKKQDEISDTGELKPESFFDGDAE